MLAKPATLHGNVFMQESRIMSKGIIAAPTNAFINGALSENLCKNTLLSYPHVLATFSLGLSLCVVLFNDTCPGLSMDIQCHIRPYSSKNHQIRHQATQ